MTLIQLFKLLNVFLLLNIVLATDIKPDNSKNLVKIKVDGKLIGGYNQLVEYL